MANPFHPKEVFKNYLKINKNKNYFHNLMVKEYYAVFYFEADHKTSLNQMPLISNNN